MKKQIIDKAYFLISATVGRLEEGGDFFEGIDVSFKAGMKDFKLTAEPGDGGSLCFIFAGEPECLDAQGFCDFIAEKMRDYDEMELCYRERGRLITVKCDGKDVKLSSTETAGRTVKPAKKAPQIFAGSAEVPDVSYDDSEGDLLGGGGASLGNREYIIKAGPASNLLKVIGILGKNGKVRNDRIRKYNQIDHFVELIGPIVESVCKGNKPVRIIDCACGKSYLSFVLNYYIKEVMGRRCYFTGLDYNPTVIEASKRMAEELGYKNMTFIQTDIGAYRPEEQFDLLLTLHACDTATDLALNFAISNNISHIVCVPCCHREMNSNYSMPGFEPLMKYGILKARMADCLTDALRAEYLRAVGYDVSIVEYISPLDTPKNLMMRAVKQRGVSEELLESFKKMESSLGTKLSIGRM
ncbi:MAG: SAM-dependent methyltransferase [Clostridia bacterium]|nr:SAM-dependent methyltransferase [Clostridia bacterium]